VQIGTPIERILGELVVTKYITPTESSPIHDMVRADHITMKSIPASLQDKADDVRNVYEFYDKLCVEEFNRIPQHFKSEWEEKGGLPYYRSQRPLLFAGGVPDVPDLLKNHIRPNVTFLNEVAVTGGGRQELIRVLDEAKTWLESTPGIGQLLKRHVIASIQEKGSGSAKRRVIGGWSPRSIIGPDGPIGMGPHHVGLAVDINASTNPHLKGEPAKTIDAVLDHLASKGKFSGDQRLSKQFVDYDAIDRQPDKAVELAVGMWYKSASISAAFKAFLTECLDKQKNKQPLDPDVQKLFDRCAKTFGKQLERYATQGIYDLDLVLVVALVKGGMRYGGEFRESKDQHHFQVREFSRSWPYRPPKCLEQWLKKK
jgi:hypothetical protein